jgi:hypothetical protein
MSLSAGIRTNRHDPPFPTSRVYFHFNLATVAFVGRVDMPCPFWFSIGVKEKRLRMQLSPHPAAKLSSAYHQQICIGYG